MPRLLWDTNALLKLYRPEIGSPYIQAMFAAETQPICLSQFTAIEFCSVLHRFKRKQLITVAELLQLQTLFSVDCRLGKFEILAMVPSQFQNADDLIRKHGQNRECQTYDAIQLAVALSLQSLHDLRHFVTADKTLLALSKAESLPVIDPENP